MCRPWTLADFKVNHFSRKFLIKKVVLPNILLIKDDKSQNKYINTNIQSHVCMHDSEVADLTCRGSQSLNSGCVRPGDWSLIVESIALDSSSHSEFKICNKLDFSDVHFITFDDHTITSSLTDSRP